MYYRKHVKDIKSDITSKAVEFYDKVDGVSLEQHTEQNGEKSTNADFVRLCDPRDHLDSDDAIKSAGRGSKKQPTLSTKRHENKNFTKQLVK